MTGWKTEGRIGVQDLAPSGAKKSYNFKRLRLIEQGALRGDDAVGLASRQSDFLDKGTDMQNRNLRSAITVAFALAAALSVGACNRKTDDTVRAPGTSSTTNSSGGTSGTTGTAPMGGTSGSRP